MAFKFNNLEEYLEKMSKGKQPVGTSVNPLGQFAIKPLQQDIKPNVNYPTPIIPDWNYEVNHPAKDGIAAEPGVPHTTGDKAFGIKGPDALGKMPLPNIEGKDHSTGNKAFSIPGDDHEGRNKAFSLEGLAHSMEDKVNKPYRFTPPFTTQEPAQPVPGPEHTTKDAVNPKVPGPEHSTVEPIAKVPGPAHSTQEPIKPRAAAPDYPTQEPIGRPGAPDYSTVDPVSRPGPPDYSTQEPIKTQFTQTHKLDKLSPSADGALLELIVNKQYKDRKELFGSPEKDGLINHLNNNQSNYLTISGDPGNMMFKFGTDDKVPAGGSSIWTHTRLGGPTSQGVQARKYMDKFARIKDATLALSAKEINYDGNSVPAAALIRRGNILTDDALTKGLYEMVGKNKFVSLRDEAARNNPRSPLGELARQPFIQRGIQKGPGNENPDSPGFLPSLDPVNGAIGMLTAPMIDALRVGKYLISPNGLLFMAKQVGLQLTNPRSEWKIGLHRGRIFNPLSFALQVPANALGIHMDRHYLGPLNAEGSKYETLVTDLDREGETLEDSKNRLVKLLDEMSVGIIGVGKTAGSKIDLLSGLMGPKSLFGIGQTRFFKHKSGMDVFFDAEAETAKYEPETPYVKGLAHGGNDGVSEAEKGSEVDLKPFTNDNDTSRVAYAREDADTYWSDKVESEVNFPGNAHMFVDPKGETNGMFNVMDYTTLGLYRDTKKKFRDFRQIDGEYDEENAYDGEGRENIVKRLGLVDWGAYSPGYGDGSGEDIYDEFEGEEAVDYIKVTISNEDDSNKCYLRAYNLEITDKLNPQYSTVAYSGNPAESHIFDKIGRAWTLKLTMAAFTSNELLNNYKKLNQLMQLSSPKIISGYAGGHITKLNVGSIWKDMPIIIKSFDYQINNDAGWDIGHGKEAGWDDGTGHAETTTKELPMMWDINLGGEFLVNADGNLWTNESKFFQDEILGVQE